MSEYIFVQSVLSLAAIKASPLSSRVEGITWRQNGPRLTVSCHVIVTDTESDDLITVPFPQLDLLTIVPETDAEPYVHPTHISANCRSVS